MCSRPRADGVAYSDPPNATVLCGNVPTAATSIFDKVMVPAG
jgi:hypothetical protein